MEDSSEVGLALPLEMVIEVFRFLSGPSRFAAALTSHQFYKKIHVGDYDGYRFSRDCAAEGLLELFKWAVEVGCPYSSTAVTLAASRCGQVHCLRFFIQEKFRFHVNCLMEALRCNQIPAYCYLAENHLSEKSSLPPSTASEKILRQMLGNYQALPRLYDLPFELAKAAVFGGHWAMAKSLVEQVRTERRFMELCREALIGGHLDLAKYIFFIANPRGSEQLAADYLLKEGALQATNIENVKTLIAMGGRVKSRDSLSEVLKRGDLAMIEALRPILPLHEYLPGIFDVALTWGHFDLIKFAIENGLVPAAPEMAINTLIEAPSEFLGYPPNSRGRTAAVKYLASILPIPKDFHVALLHSFLLWADGDTLAYLDQLRKVVPFQPVGVIMEMADLMANRDGQVRYDVLVWVAALFKAEDAPLSPFFEQSKLFERALRSRNVAAIKFVIDFLRKWVPKNLNTLLRLYYTDSLLAVFLPNSREPHWYRSYLIAKLLKEEGWKYFPPEHGKFWLPPIENKWFLKEIDKLGWIPPSDKMHSSTSQK